MYAVIRYSVQFYADLVRLRTILQPPNLSILGVESPPATRDKHASLTVIHTCTVDYRYMAMVTYFL